VAANAAILASVARCSSSHARAAQGSVTGGIGPAGAGSPDIPDNPAWDAISIAAEATWT
jgi:hypothetical protein